MGDSEEEGGEKERERDTELHLAVVKTAGIPLGIGVNANRVRAEKALYTEERRRNEGKRDRKTAGL